MFSATWPKEIRKIAAEFCTKNPVHIKIGETDSANTVKGLTVNNDITQVVHIADQHSKFEALKKVINQMRQQNMLMKKMVDSNKAEIKESQEKTSEIAI